MKHLFSGVALAALLAAGGPAMAQTSSGDSTKQPAASQSGTAATGASMSSDSAGKSSGSSKKSGTAKHVSSPSDHQAEALNRQELQRVQSGDQTSGSGQSQPPAKNPATGVDKH